MVGGVYRHVRNPMYLAVGSLIVGQALLLGQWGLLAYAVLFGAVVFCFVRLHEEPTLRHALRRELRRVPRRRPGLAPAAHAVAVRLSLSSPSASARG